MVAKNLSLKLHYYRIHYSFDVCVYDYQPISSGLGSQFVFFICLLS